MKRTRICRTASAVAGARRAAACSNLEVDVKLLASSKRGGFFFTWKTFRGELDAKTLFKQK